MTDQPDTEEISEETAAEIAFLQLWAAQNKCHLELEGEVGFGRECVGIVHGDHYVDMVHYDGNYREVGDSAPWDLVHPPVGEVPDRYHKHDCLCVLGRGPDKIHQLYVWVKHLADHNIGVGFASRQPEHVIDAMIHGTKSVFLVVKDQTDGT